MTRDDIIRLMEWHPSFDRNQTDGLLARIEKVAQAAAAAEREACARLCEDASKPREGEMHSDAQWAGLVLSAAIRARGNK
jgi:hypothetical protein